MKLEKIFIMILMICMIGLPALADGTSMSIAAGSRYICYGLDFLEPNKALYKLSFEIPAGNFTFGPHAIPGSGYGELGCFVGYSFEASKKINITIATVPIIWQYEGDNFKMAFVNMGFVNLNVPLNPTFGICYAHLPFDTEQNGFYFSLGISESIVGFDFAATAAYNKEMFLANDIQGFGGIIEVSKKVKLSEKLLLKGTFQRWLNDPDINENETVFLISLLHKF